MENVMIRITERSRVKKLLKLRYFILIRKQANFYYVYTTEKKYRIYVISFVYTLLLQLYDYLKIFKYF